MRRIVFRCLAVVVAIAATICVLAAPAAATWSVVGSDEETGEVGVAIASCVPVSQLGPLDQPLFLVALVPNVGAGVSQAQINPAAPRRMETLLDIGRTPEQIIADVSSEDFDEQFDARQHAVVTLDGSSANFTGENTNALAADAADRGVAVQGNLLASASVVPDALAAFGADPSLPLADRLVAALLAGSEAGGDQRCGQTALFAHVVVVAPGDDVTDPSVLLTYGAFDDDDNPVRSLADDFAAGERRNVSAPSADGAGSSVGLIGLVAAVVMVGAGVVFARRAFRPNRYP